MDYSKIKVIYYDSTEINLDNIIWGLLQLGMDVSRSKLRVNLTQSVPEEIETIKKELVNYQYAITQNFSVNVAAACYDLQMPYISWVYDSPQIALYSKFAQYDTNFVFAFDKNQVVRLKNIGLKNVYHMPLAANIAYVSTINITKDDIRKYRADVAFVGQLYRQWYMSDFFKKIPPKTLEELHLKAEEKALLWGPDISIFNSISDESAQVIAAFMDEEGFDDYCVDKKFGEEVMLLAPLIAQLERKTLLKLSGEKFRTALYTKESDYEYAAENIPGVKIFGPVRHEEPYKVYYSTKLNLNISYRCIETGAPQRIFDIMSVGGTVISNYQKELEELFEPDKEIILFNSSEEFIDKAQFYLNHSTAREKIRIAGYNKVKNNYTYPIALSTMFDIVSKSTQ